MFNTVKICKCNSINVHLSTTTICLIIISFLIVQSTIFKFYILNRSTIAFSLQQLLLFTKPLNCQSRQLSSALSSACDFKSHFCQHCGPRSDCSLRSSLIRVHTVCLYAKIGLKSLQEYSADDINRRHF